MNGIITYRLKSTFLNSMNDESDSLLLSPSSLRFYVTPTHPCSYFPDRQAVTLVVDPTCPLSKATYSSLSELGFRRSGDHVYRPHCGTCHDCIPVRVPVAAFTPNRSQRRTLKCNQNLQIIEQNSQLLTEHFDLYQRYVKTRHPAGGMDDSDAEQYMQFIHADWCATRLFEFRQNEVLVAVAVTDILDNGLSAVYTFYDPDRLNLNLGTYAILWQIQECQRRQLEWLYLGYWIPENDKMQYKSQFQPQEFFDGQQWLPRAISRR